MSRIEPNGLRFRHFHDSVSGRLVGTICTKLDPDCPGLVIISASICSFKDTPSKVKGRMISQRRLEMGKTRTMSREMLKIEISERSILSWFDCGPNKFTLRPANKRLDETNDAYTFSDA